MCKSVVRVTLALLGAGLFFVAWLAVFLLTRDVDHPVLHALRWLLGPVVTAAGFAAGLVLGERVTRAQTTSFWRTLLWSLVGCGIGAGAVYPFGPMLIVFGMFAGGTASMVAREVVPYLGALKQASGAEETTGHPAADKRES